MITEAQLAWCPPILMESLLGRMWVAPDRAIPDREPLHIPWESPFTVVLAISVCEPFAEYRMVAS